MFTQPRQKLMNDYIIEVIKQKKFSKLIFFSVGSIRFPIFGTF